MNLKKIIILTIAMIPMLAIGQITHTAKGDIDKNAQNILKKASGQYSKEAVRFDVTMVNYNTSKKETARKKATVTYKAGAYHILFDDQELISDGKSVWHWNKTSKEVVASTLSDKPDDVMNPALLLKNYEKQFKAKYIRTEENGDAVIDLTPRKSMSYHKLRLIIVEKSGVVKKIEIHNYDGSRGEYLFANYKSKVKTAESDFTFSVKQHPEVELIDMR